MPNGLFHLEPEEEPVFDLLVRATNGQGSAFIELDWQLPGDAEDRHNTFAVTPRTVNQATLDHLRMYLQVIVLELGNAEAHLYVHSMDCRKVAVQWLGDLDGWRADQALIDLCGLEGMELL